MLHVACGTGGLTKTMASQGIVVVRCKGQMSVRGVLTPGPGGQDLRGKGLERGGMRP